MTFVPKHGHPSSHYEMGYKGELTTRNKGILYQTMYPAIPEASREFHEPPVEDGKGSGVTAEDASYASRPYSMRVQPGETIKEIKLKQYYNNPEVKHILENYDISKEHPGLEYKVGMFGGYTEGSGAMGLGTGHFRNFGWKYFDKPDGEGCHEKVFAGAKYGLVLAFALFAGHQGYTAGIREMNLKTLRQVMARYPSYCYIPVAGFATFSAASCMSCNLRGKDDPWNYALGGLAMGLPVWARAGAMFGIAAGAYGAIFGATWKYIMHLHRGIGSPETGVEMWSHPQAWRWEWLPYFKHRKGDRQHDAVMKHLGHPIPE